MCSYCVKPWPDDVFVGRIPMARRGRRGQMGERRCKAEGCEKRAKRGSIHCLVHAQSAVWRAARRELRDLLRELEKLSGVTDATQRRRAEIRFSRKVESGRYALLFSPELRELEEERQR